MEVHLTLEGRLVAVSFNPETWEATVDGKTYPVTASANSASQRITVGGQEVHVGVVEDHRAHIDGVTVPFSIEHLEGIAGAPKDGAGSGQVKTPMTGRLIRIAVAPGDAVEKGDVLFILEAMKMQNEVRAPVSGIVQAIHGEVGSSLEPQTIVVEIA